jgi:transcriptional regulator with XRE-family HTH domain
LNYRERRKALGWSRADLAERTGINTAAIALIERGEWTEDDALTRVVFVLGEAEAGNLDVKMAPPKPG